MLENCILVKENFNEISYSLRMRPNPKINAIRKMFLCVPNFVVCGQSAFRGGRGGENKRDIELIQNKQTLDILIV